MSGKNQPTTSDVPAVVMKKGSTTTAVSQFIAILSSSHPRCGAHSPARIICSVGPIMCAMWRDLVVATARHFIAVLGRSFSLPASWCSVPIIVSPLLNSVLNSSNVTCTTTGPLKWLSQHVVLKADYQAVDGASVATAGVSDGRPTIRLQTGLGSTSSFANRKWLVVTEHSISNDSGRALSIRRLPDESSIMGSCSSCVVVEPAAVVFVPEGDVAFVGFFENFLDPDEVLMCTTELRNTVFRLIDVGSTFQSKRLVVAASVQVGLRCLLCSVCAMRRSSGGVVFVASTMENRNRGIKAVDCTTGSAKQLSHRGIAVVQVDACVFCVCTKEMASYEVWDCNNLDQPLRIVETGCGLAPANEIVGGRWGFMLVLLDSGEVVVMDARSGFIVTSLVVSFTPPSEFHIRENSLLG